MRIFRLVLNTLILLDIVARFAVTQPHLYCRAMGTPDDTVWPGVSRLPFFQSLFPKWKPKDKLVPRLDEAADDLARVCLLPYQTFKLVCSGSSQYRTEVVACLDGAEYCQRYGYDC
jgi:hypothetical protein